MSFFKELGSIWKRVRFIARSHWNFKSKSKTDVGHDVSLLGKDDVVVAVAERQFNEIYPEVTTVPNLNRFSLANTLASGLSTGLFAASVVGLGVFVLNAGFGAYALWKGTTGLTFLLIELSKDLGFTGLSLAASNVLSRVDRDLTMKKCLGMAERLLLDRRAYYEERALLEMKRIGADIDAEQKSWEDKLSLREDELQVINDAYNNVREIGNLTEADEAELSELQKKVEFISKQIDAIKEKKMALEVERKARIEDSRRTLALAPLVEISETLYGIKTGELERELKEMEDDTKERLSALRESSEDLRKNVLVEAGIDEVSTPLLEGSSNETLKLLEK